MSLRLGRKEYHINAVIAAVPTPIFGWDIFDKYKLSLDWNDQGDLVVMDKKADISSGIQIENFKFIARSKNKTKASCSKPSIARGKPQIFPPYLFAAVEG